jgi:tetratricopeptide (TPR) repeat protein
MDNINDILTQAHSFFTNEQYDKALFLYSQALSLNPSNKEIQLYCIFCDIASENSQKGQALFDYFTIAKVENFNGAVQYIMDIISAHDGNTDKMMKILNDFSLKTTESLDAIRYEDFQKLIQQRGSFKVAFQDIMFSTKVALTSKDEFFQFVNQLIENNFEKTAYQYLDSFIEYFKYDKKMMELYDKLGGKTIDFNDK